MSRSPRRAFLKSTTRLATGCAVLGPTILCARRSLAAPSACLTLLHTNDTHSRLEPFADGPFEGRGGVSRRATLIKRARAKNPNTLVLDAGDTFQGTPWFNEFKGSADLEAMDLMGYDATALGNHDFDAGVAVLSANLQRAPQLAALAANFEVDKGSPLAGRVQAHRIYERVTADEAHPLKVGVFGLGIRFEGLVNPRMHEGVRYLDPIPVAREQVERLRDLGCQVVIAVSHLGYQGYAGEPGDLVWPKEVPGVDYVVGGHTHTFLSEPSLVRHHSGWETPVMQVGHSGLNLGVAEILVDVRGRARLVHAAPRGVGGAATA